MEEEAKCKILLLNFQAGTVLGRVMEGNRRNKRNSRDSVQEDKPARQTALQPSHKIDQPVPKRPDTKRRGTLLKFSSP